MVQLGFLKVLKGSLIREQACLLGLVYSDDPPYRILRTKEMTSRELDKLRDIARMTEIFRNTGNFRSSLSFLCTNVFHGDWFRLFSGLAGHYRVRNGFGRIFSAKENILVFLEFGIKSCSESQAGDPVHFRDLLKYDKYRYDARSFIAELGMNMSPRHPEMPEELFHRISSGISTSKNFKSRCEKYCFDATGSDSTQALQVRSEEARTVSFVIYNISSDRPEKIAAVRI